MNVRHLFGKPLPRGLRIHGRQKTSAGNTTVMLAIAALVTWVVVALLAKDMREAEEMVYFWPE